MSPEALEGRDWLYTAALLLALVSMLISSRPRVPSGIWALCADLAVVAAGLLWLAAWIMAQLS